MSAEQIENLSPAEKFDIVNGQFDYPTVNSERSRCSPYLDEWEGLCDGWAQASTYFEEPKPITIKTDDGISVPFGSSDIKALLIYYLAIVKNENFKLLGERCNGDSTYNSEVFASEEYNDVNAGAFHIILTNFVGIKKHTIIADIVPDNQVWNKPIFAYETSFSDEKFDISDNAARGTMKEIEAITKIKYRTETEKSWTPLNNDPKYTKEQTYRYILELDKDDEIIGGRWISKSHPDFLWTREIPDFTGKYKNIELIYNMSISQ